MMQFGDIVEPSTRALILDDDDLEELPEYKKPVYEWEGNCQPTDDIDILIFIDSKKVVQTCSRLCTSTPPLARLIREGLSLYKLNNKFLIVFDGNSRNMVLGEVVELLSPWIKKAKTIHCITSTLISTFQPSEKLNISSAITFTRCLTNHEAIPYNFCDRLELPNLIQGFSASILTYCVYNNIKASLWVVYTDSMPIDSMNSAEIIRLFKMLGLDVKVDFAIGAASSNLYM